MILLEALQQKLGCAEPWVEKGGVHWLDPDALTVRELCMEMIACHARFITIPPISCPKTKASASNITGISAACSSAFPFC